MYRYRCVCPITNEFDYPYINEYQYPYMSSYPYMPISEYDAFIRMNYPGSPISQGSTNTPAVTWIQGRLKIFYNTGTQYFVPVGTFGPKTTKAVKSFQSDVPGLTVDGVVGQATWAALQRVTGFKKLASIQPIPTSQTVTVYNDTGDIITRVFWTAQGCNGTSPNVNNICFSKAFSKDETSSYTFAAGTTNREIKVSYSGHEGICSVDADTGFIRISDIVTDSNCF